MINNIKKFDIQQQVSAQQKERQGVKRKKTLVKRQSTQKDGEDHHESKSRKQQATSENV